jgi:hypothetical protein
VDAVRAHEHVIVADGAIAQAHASTLGAGVDGFYGRAETDRRVGRLPEERVELPPMHGYTGIRRAPDFVEINLEQQPASMVQDALLRDPAPAAQDGLVEPEHPEHSDTIGREKEAGADLVPFALALDDLGGEPTLP